MNQFVRILLSTVLILLASPPLVRGLEVLTLQEAFRTAVGRSESLAMREESIRIAEAHYLQALGTALPQLKVGATEALQDTSGVAGGDSIGSTFTRRSRPEVAVTLNQPLFQGFREFRALKISGAEMEKNSYERDRARELLFFDVARAYYTVLELEDQQKILASLRGTIRTRIDELKERLRLGKSRGSELLVAESHLATLEARMEKTRGLVKTSREMLAFLTGRGVEERLVDGFRIPSEIGSLESHLARLPSRPDLNASLEAVRLSQGRLDYEKGGRLPTVDLEANYYPYRVGFLSDIDWDLTFNLNLPIFRGGATRGKIREADALLKQSRLSREETVRRAESDLRQAYESFLSSRSEETALRLAERKAAANYEAQVKDYRLGLINHLELLQSLRDWQENRLETNRVHYQTKLNYLQLKTAAGDLPGEETE